MNIKTLKTGIPPNVTRFSDNALLSATKLPGALSYESAANLIHKCSTNECDLQNVGVGLWILDSNAQMGPPPKLKGDFPPSRRNEQDEEVCAIFRIPEYTFSVGRSLDRCDLALPYDYVSREHLAITLHVGSVRIENRSRSNGVYIGGGWIGPTERIFITTNAPFLIRIGEPLSHPDGSMLICPIGSDLDDAKTELRGRYGPLDEFVMVNRQPWRKMGISHQASDPSEQIVTPPQIVNTDKYIVASCEELRGEGADVRKFIRGWAASSSKKKKGRLDKHVKGHKNWDRRLLDNVRLGGMLLATHSTDLAGAIAILESSKIDPQYFRKGKAFFRYGLGHSYGEIVFVQQPGVSGLGNINDIWGVMIRGLETRQELYRLVQKVDYNKSIPVKAGDPAPDDPEGRSAVVQLFDENALMELFPQFESYNPVPIANTYAILAPDHLYDNFIGQIEKQFHQLVIRIPRTGKREQDFRRKLDKVARRTRVDGGTFQPKIGRDALFRYELMYFKIVENVLRFRHRALRKKIDEFARAVTESNLPHDDIMRHISETTALLPEAFRVLHLQQQYPSHDGHSPLGHTMNAVLEAAYLAPKLAREFEGFHTEDVFTALWLHDLGKMRDATSDEHGALSIEMAKYHLKMMDLKGKNDTEEQIRRERILYLMKNAGVISKASKALKRGESISSIRNRLFPYGRSYLPEIFLLNFADTASIPGRSGRQMRVNKEYESVVDVRRELIETFRKLQ